jgi:hypothetical protein
MKTIFLLMMGVLSVAPSIAEPSKQGPSPEGCVFQPARAFSPVSSVTLRNAPIGSSAQALASVTQKEVFVSARVHNITLPDFEMQGADSALVAKALIKLIESAKEPEVSVVEIGSGILAIVERAEDPIKRK